MTLSTKYFIISLVLGTALCQYQNGAYRTSNRRQTYYQQQPHYQQQQQTYQDSQNYEQPNSYQPRDTYESAQTYQSQVQQPYQQPQQGYQLQQQPVQQTQQIYTQPQYQPKYTKAYPAPQNLFTPAEKPYPAATAGQIKNYQDAIEEEIRGPSRNEYQQTQEYPRSSSARTHVNVKQNQDQGYSYEIQL